MKLSAALRPCRMNIMSTSVAFERTGAKRRNAGLSFSYPNSYLRSLSKTKDGTKSKAIIKTPRNQKFVKRESTVSDMPKTL